MLKLNRLGRLVVGLLGPAIISSIMIILYVFVKEVINEGLSLRLFQALAKGFVVFWVAGAFFISIQSLVYTIVMEFIVRPKVRPLYAYLIVSCMLGAVSGMVLDVTFDNSYIFKIFGLTVGLLTGLLLFRKDLASPHKKTVKLLRLLIKYR